MSTTTPDHTLGAIRAMAAPSGERTVLDHVSKPALLKAMRHLVDVVGRQHEVLSDLEWSALSVGLTPHCPQCGNHKYDGHKPDCVLDALLRETMNDPTPVDPVARVGGS